jgi:pyruvate formate lyase activating enzyme
MSSQSVLLSNARLCQGCQLCAMHCPEGVHAFVAGVHKVEFDRCTTCGECLKFCMAEALSIHGRVASVDDVMKEIIQDRDYYEASGGGVTISGGEPLQQPDAVVALARACRKEQISVYLDTCGFASRKTFLTLTEVVDGFLFDVKMIDPRAHRAYTGVDNSRILANFRLAVASGKAVRMRVIIIPGLTDTDANLAGLVAFARACRLSGPVDLMPYHRMGAAKYRNMGRDYLMEGVEPPSRERLELVRSFSQREGFLSTIQ